MLLGLGSIVLININRAPPKKLKAGKGQHNILTFFLKIPESKRDTSWKEGRGADVRKRNGKRRQRVILKDQAMCLHIILFQMP